MDEVMMIRFALDNAHPPELGKQGHLALDRLLEARATADRGSASGGDAEHRRPAQQPSPTRQRARPTKPC